MYGTICVCRANKRYRLKSVAGVSRPIALSLLLTLIDIWREISVTSLDVPAALVVTSANKCRNQQQQRKTYISFALKYIKAAWPIEAKFADDTHSARGKSGEEAVAGGCAR